MNPNSKAWTKTQPEPEEFWTRPITSSHYKMQIQEISFSLILNMNKLMFTNVADIFVSWNSILITVNVISNFHDTKMGGELFN